MLITATGCHIAAKSPHYLDIQYRREFQSSIVFVPNKEVKVLHEVPISWGLSAQSSVDVLL